MSFLYKALLKDSAKKDQNEQVNLTGNPAQASMFAQPQTTSIPAAIWALIGGLLLIIGLLGGYLLGQTPTNIVHSQQVTNEVRDTGTANDSVTNKIASTDSLTAQNENLSEVASQAPTEVTAQTPSADVSVTANSVDVANTAQPVVQEEPIKQIEIGKNEQGQLVTSVTDAVNQATNAPTERQQDALTTANDNDLPIAEVSEDLRSQFAMAVEATEELPLNSYSEVNISTGSSLMSIHELSDAEKAGIPPLYYGMHIFATDPNERWVKINNQILKEGDDLMPGLRLLEIRQDLVVWETHFIRFMQEALDDFAG
ncbi:general secretion pathway protein GspB [Psychrosphaera sp. 1_MG-2023]|uniref:general secretion pathway protein GspB n=1 Tax=Psychrosphaera sp. 1_MG-2023 TaxID=3062643 RepID=UPI0026E284E4|nr:general secretion pathway protein GspB [Psychrosphaera sp. 1_MG-2023]MDO6719398.1 general secretion pathway protein GspB [Psychrosphaera sp. 1_MG-2023]